MKTSKTGQDGWKTGVDGCRRVKTGRRVDGSTRRVDGSTRRVHGFEPWPDTPTPDPDTRPTLSPTAVSGQCQAILTIYTCGPCHGGVKSAPTPPTSQTPDRSPTLRHPPRHSDTPTLRQPDTSPALTQHCVLTTVNASRCLL